MDDLEKPAKKEAAMLSANLDCDIAVIGGGIIGVCCALELQDAGFDVMLIDRKGIAAECSYGNAGHIAAEHILPLATPSVIAALPSLLFTRNPALRLPVGYLAHVMPWLVRFAWSARPAQVRRATTATAHLNSLALPAYLDLEARFGLEGLLRQDGTLVAYETERAFAKARRDTSLLAAHDIETEVLDQGALHAFDSALNPSLVGGIRFPGSAHTVDPAALTHLLASHFTRLGGRILIAKVSSVMQEQYGIRTSASCGPVLSRKLVIAAGAWSHRLLAPLGWSVPLETERGYHLMATSPTVKPRLPTTHAERRFVATPMRHGLRLAGRVELGGLDLPPSVSLATDLMAHGQAMMPDLKAETLTPWMGFRPTLADSLPVIGPVPDAQDIYCAFGHHHLGLTQAAATGQLIRDLVLDGKAATDLAPYRLNRF